MQTNQFDQNPFSSIMGKLGPMGGSQRTPQQMPQTQPPQQQIPGSTQQQTMQAQMPKQLVEGQEGTGSKFLLGAIQNLQGYIQMSTDPRKIQMLRQLVTVFVNLLANEQQEATQELQGYSEPEEGEEMPPMMGGMGGGMNG